MAEKHYTLVREVWRYKNGQKVIMQSSLARNKCHYVDWM
jgi:hypothetical protein